jgi:glycine/D-amino acid oxidase-like deaminating enzyme
VTAKDVIVATSVPTLPLAARGGYCALEYPTESFIVAGELGQGITGMYISPDSNHYSILPITVDERRMILIGGEGGHLPGLSKNTEQKFQRLAEYANKHFNVGLVTHQWSDRDYTAYDNLPIIGKLYRWSKHLYVGSAYRKWGLSNGTVAAMVLSDTILGNQNQWTKVFDSTRLQPVKYIPRAALEYIKQNLG